MHRDDDHHDFGGLTHDLVLTAIAMDRRRALRVGLSLGAIHLIGCNSGGATGTAGTTNNGNNGSNNVSCTKLPEETAGPFPGDASNGPNVLNVNGVVRQDIRSSFGGLSGTAAGVPLTLTLTIVTANSCVPLANRALYLWHCDRDGGYSLYNAGVQNQNYCRGVQLSDANGKVTFQTIFPGCYAGRWPHMHFEVYPSLAVAISAAGKIATSQLAFPKDVCDLVYASPGYASSATNLSRVSLATDNVFSDGATNQIANVSGSVAAGYTATLTVPV